MEWLKCLLVNIINRILVSTEDSESFQYNFRSIFHFVSFRFSHYQTILDRELLYIEMTWNRWIERINANKIWHFTWTKRKSNSMLHRYLVHFYSTFNLCQSNKCNNEYFQLLHLLVNTVHLMCTAHTILKVWLFVWSFNFSVGQFATTFFVVQFEK